MIHPASRRRACFIHAVGQLPIRLDQTDSLQDRALKVRWRGGYGMLRPVDYRRWIAPRNHLYVPPWERSSVLQSAGDLRRHTPREENPLVRAQRA